MYFKTAGKDEKRLKVCEEILPVSMWNGTGPSNSDFFKSQRVNLLGNKTLCRCHCLLTNELCDIPHGDRQNARKTSQTFVCFTSFPDIYIYTVCL